MSDEVIEIEDEAKQIEKTLRLMPRIARARAQRMSQSSYVYRFMRGEITDKVTRLTRRYWSVGGIEVRLPQALELLRHGSI